MNSQFSAKNSTGVSHAMRSGGWVLFAEATNDDDLFFADKCT